LIRNYAQMLDCEVALLCQSDRGRKPRIISCWGIEGALEPIVGPRRRVRRGRRGSFISRALAHGRPALERLDPDRDRGLIAATGGRPSLSHAAATPVRVSGPLVVGLIAGFSTYPQDFSLTLATAESYAALMALCLQHPGMLDALLEAARRDELTACLGADSTYDELNREINRCSRGGLRLSGCFIDLDGYEHKNDRHSRRDGIDVLAAAAQLLGNGLRSSDSLGRFGENEFFAILPQTDEATARGLAVRLQSLIGTVDVRPFQRPLKASFGIAEWTPGTSARQLVTRARSATIAAKAQNAGIISVSQATATAVTASGGPSLTPGTPIGCSGYPAVAKPQFHAESDDR
jgi:diguanylate cyclase (GGDEF)-like protein